VKAKTSLSEESLESLEEITKDATLA